MCSMISIPSSLSFVKLLKMLSVLAKSAVDPFIHHGNQCCSIQSRLQSVLRAFSLHVVPDKKYDGIYSCLMSMMLLNSSEILNVISPPSYTHSSSMLRNSSCCSSECTPSWSEQKSFSSLWEISCFRA